jgi:predicted nucleic acid-binding protein
VSLVISDTTPLNYLILIGESEVLPGLFGRLIVPPAVIREMQHSKAPPAVSAWAAAIPGWVEVRAPKAIADLQLDHGETEAIALALEMPNSALLLDDRRGRRVAEERGILVVGTIAVLDLADEAGLLHFEQALELLSATTFYVEDEIIRAARERVRARRA